MPTRPLYQGARLVAFTIGLGLSVASAGETVGSLIVNGLEALCGKFGAIVSAAEGNFGTRNQFGCVGAFQFCPATLFQYFAGTAEQFLQDPKAQIAAWTNYEKTQWALASKGGLTSLIGQALAFGGKSVTIDASAILMACQFGCGKFGKLANYLNGHDCSAQNVKDGNGVSVCTYLVRGAGQEVSCFTGQAVSGIKPTPVQIGGAGTTVQAGGSSTIAQSGGTGATACPAASQFGSDGPVEIVVGQYTLRFGSSISADTLKKILQVVEKK